MTKNLEQKNVNVTAATITRLGKKKKKKLTFNYKDLLLMSTGGSFNGE